MSLVQREITCTITLASDAGTTFANGQNTVTLSGLRVAVHITNAGMPQLDTAEIRIWGMLLSDMNALSRLGKPLNWTRSNTITVQAGDSESGMAQVFSGFMQSAFIDFDGMPDVCLNVMAITNIVTATQSATPTSFPGTASIATIMQQLASKAGLGFLNSGVNVQLSNAYYTGSPIQQMEKAARAANCWWIPNGGHSQNQVEIWPKNTPRGAMGPVISSDSGLVGYPKYNDYGVELRYLYSPGLQFGQAFTLKSSLKLDAETWYIIHLDAELTCNDPSGDNPWFYDILATLLPQDVPSSPNSPQASQ